MIVIKYPQIWKNKEDVTIILGSFASFHNGHNALLKEAQKFQNKIMIMLIANPENLPSVFKKKYESLEIRLQKLSNLKIDYALVVYFDHNIQKINGFIFLKQLIKNYQIKKIIIGQDFAMGQNKSLISQQLQNTPNVVIVKHKKINKQKISTNLMIESVLSGNVDLIKTISPFYFTIDIQVYNNVFDYPEKTLKPSPGIYASWAAINDLKYWAVVQISIENKCKIIISEFEKKQILNFKSRIEFVFKIRTIFKKEQEFIDKKDIELVLKYLHKLEKNKDMN